MSADKPTPATQTDTATTAADQGQQAGRPTGGGEQHADAHARQPREKRTRQEVADVVLAHPPGRAPEATAAAPSSDGKQAEQAGKGHVPAQGPEGSQQAGHRRESRLRQEYADARLAHPPGYTSESAPPATSGQDVRHGGHATSDRGAAPARHQERHSPAPGESTAAIPSQPHARAGEAVVAPSGQHRSGEVKPSQSGEGAPPSDQDRRHAPPVHRDEQPQSHPEGQDGQAGTPRADRAGDDRRPTPSPEASNPDGRDVARKIAAGPGDERTSSPDSQNGQSASSTATESQQGARGGRDQRESAVVRPEGPTAPAPAGQGRDDEWTQADRDRVRALYADDFGPKPATGGRDQGVNVVGNKPDKSPGDTSDLPPSGKELLERAEDDAPRPEKFRNKFYEGIDDISQGATPMVNAAREYLEQPPPTGHPGVVTDTHPYFTPESPSNATPGVGDIIELTLVAGVLADRTIHWGRRIIAEKMERGRH
jgi:hypothetical protein